MSGTETTPRGAGNESGTYEIRVTGHLDNRWADWFDGLSITHESDGNTVLRGRIVDQAALHGLLQKIRDLALPLISVAEVETDPPDAHSPTSMTHQPTTGSTP